MTGELEIHRASEAERAAAVELCRSALGWRSGDLDERFFSWKHDENPAGRSPMWVAVEPGGQLVGVRVFLRWDLVDRSGAPRRAVRAVDTATHPDWQGRGIFRRLTLHALGELQDEGVDLVFNTPNTQSRPGYLKMGWSEVGQFPVAVRLRSPRSIVRVARARTAAEKWSLPTDVGRSATEALDDPAIVALLDRAGMSAGWHTARTVAHLRWRYSFDELRYRGVSLGRDVEDGLVILRLRRRGAAVEGTICEVLLPEGGCVGAKTWGSLAKAAGADYLIRARSASAWRDGFLPGDRLGPTMTWRPLCAQGIPALSDIRLSLGDIELF